MVYRTPLRSDELYTSPVRSDELYFRPIRSDELYHYGIMGMHWGIRRFQPYSTTGPRKGGKTGKEIGQAARRAVRSIRRNNPIAKYKRHQQKKAIAKAKQLYRQQEAEKRYFDDHKDRILRSADPDKIIKYQFHMTDKEFSDAIKRIKDRDGLMELAASRKPNLQKTIKKYINVAEDLYKAGNNTAKVVKQLQNFMDGDLDAKVSDDQLMKDLQGWLGKAMKDAEKNEKKHVPASS